MSGTIQTTLSQADRPAEAIQLRREAADVLRDLESGLAPVRRLTGVTTPDLAAYRTWRRPHEDGARDRLEWAKRYVDAGTAQSGGDA